MQDRNTCHCSNLSRNAIVLTDNNTRVLQETTVAEMSNVMSCSQHIFHVNIRETQKKMKVLQYHMAMCNLTNASVNSKNYLPSFSYELSTTNKP